MLDQPLLLDPHLYKSLLKLNQYEVLAAIELLEHRLRIMQSPDYYLQIPVTDLPLPPSFISQLLRHEIRTVRELQLCDLEQVKLYQHVGDKRLLQLKTLLVKIEEMKDDLKGITGYELRDRLSC